MFGCIVVGAGHAGYEVAMTLARFEQRVLLITGSVDRIGHLSCGPAIGGLTKGRMVREIDTLDSMMGLWANRAGIQFHTLNAGKGPAVRTTHAQTDHDSYMEAAKAALFTELGITTWQDTMDEVLKLGGRAAGIRTELGQTFEAPHAILTTGMLLCGLIHMEFMHFPGGRLGDITAMKLSDSLRKHGPTLGHLKTRTTLRLLRSSIDFSQMEGQPGDDPAPDFSFCGPRPEQPQVSCCVTWTNERTYDAIRSGMDRSPLFTGIIEDTGAHYCPSVGDKVAWFLERERHHVFIEPEGLNGQECYANGISTSLLLGVQLTMIASIPDFERAEMVRPSYAIGYDYMDPIQLEPTLEAKVLPGLWPTGQINGASGYEEATAQGMRTAINVECRLTGRQSFLPDRDVAYMSMLADDLVTRETQESYRMFTSRVEYRLLLHEADADVRLTPLGRELGLVDNEQWSAFRREQDALERLLDMLREVRISSDVATSDAFRELGEPVLNKSLTLEGVLKRPSMTLEQLERLYPGVAAFPEGILLEAKTSVKCAGYLVRQDELVKRFARLEEARLPTGLDYPSISGLSTRIVEKLCVVRPRTPNQAGCISEVTSAALTCLEIHLEKRSLFGQP